MNYPLKLNLRAFWTSAFVSIAALLGFYIFQINAFVSETWQIRSYQQKISELAQINSALEIQRTKVNYLNNLEPKIKELGFEKIDVLRYIQIIDSAVAASPQQQQ